MTLRRRSHVPAVRLKCANVGPIRRKLKAKDLTSFLVNAGDAGDADCHKASCSWGIAPATLENTAISMLNSGKNTVLMRLMAAGLGQTEACQTPALHAARVFRFPAHAAEALLAEFLAAGLLPKALPAWLRAS